MARVLLPHVAVTTPKDVATEPAMLRADFVRMRPLRHGRLVPCVPRIRGHVTWGRVRWNGTACASIPIMPMPGVLHFQVFCFWNKNITFYFLQELDQLSCTWPIRLGQNDRMVREIISCFHQRSASDHVFYHQISMILVHTQFSNLLLIEFILLV